MALQTSGAISINNLATEFGGNTPHAINEYYRGGGLVPDTAANAGVPTSGQVDLNDFYGGDSTPASTGPAAGALYTWGNNSGKNFGGMLGHGDQTTRNSPVQVLGGGTNWAGGSTSGISHPLTATKTDGKIWIIGGNYSSQVTGNLQGGTQTATSPAVMFAGATGFGWLARFVQDQTRVVKSDGRTWAWGKNSNGELGDGTNTDRNSPVQTSGGGTNWVYDKYAHTATSGTKTDGRLWQWGANAHGALGTGNLTTYSSPVQTASPTTDWSYVRGGLNTFGVKTDGRLWTWGYNYYGVLGHGNAYTEVTIPPPFRNGQDRSSPVQVLGGGTNWELPVDHGALKTDGRLWQWGQSFPNNGSSLVGNVARSSPVENLVGGTNWTKETARVAAIKSDGKMWVWGALTDIFPDGATSKSSPAVVGAQTDWESFVGGSGSSMGGIRS